MDNHLVPEHHVTGFATKGDTLLLKTVLWSLFLLVLVPSASRAQNQISSHVLASGGLTSGPAIRTLAVIGESIAGRSNGSSQGICSGFGCAFGSSLSGSSTAVFLSFFDATLDDHQVSLSWEVLSADALVGFNVYRASSPDGTYVQINESILEGSQARHFVDQEVEPQREYSYKLGAVDRDGEFLSEPRTITTPRWVTELRQNFPNPFNPTTNISFYLTSPTEVSLRIYDNRGQLVTTLLREKMTSGDHTLQWDGTNSRGQSVSSGIYFVRFVTDDRTFSSKLTLLK